MKAYFASEISTSDYKDKVEAFYSKLDAKQYSSVLYYSDGGHKRVNYASSPVGEALAKDIASALQHVPRSMKTVYRASDDFSAENINIGDIIAFPAFVSTSYNPQIAFKFLNKTEPTVFVIKTTHGAEISMVHDEMEVLLPQGIEFKVTKINVCNFHAAYPDTDYHIGRENVTTIHLEEI